MEFVFQRPIFQILIPTLNLGHVFLICDNTVTTQNLWFFRRKFKKFWSAIIFYGCNDEHNCSPAASFVNCVMTLYMLKSASANVTFYNNNSKKPNVELWKSCRRWAIQLGML